MDLGPLRSMMTERACESFGVDVVITIATRIPPTISTRGIWMRPITEDPPFGREYNRRAPRWLMAFRRDVIDQIPRGAIITAMGPKGEPASNYQVDGIDSFDQESLRVIVVPETGAAGIP